MFSIIKFSFLVKATIFIALILETIYIANLPIPLVGPSYTLLRYFTNYLSLATTIE